jgi:hypothetical protein
MQMREATVERINGWWTAHAFPCAAQASECCCNSSPAHHVRNASSSPNGRFKDAMRPRRRDLMAINLRRGRERLPGG